MTTALLSTDEQMAFIREAATTATELQFDMLALVPIVALERARLDRDGLMADEISFWYKSLVHATLSFADGLSNNLRALLNAHRVELIPFANSKQRRVIEDPSRKRDLKIVLTTTFRLTPLLFGASSFQLDTSSADYRAFAAMIKARDRFTHPKRPKDVHPLATLAAMNSAIEWLLHSWRDLLLACSASILPSKARESTRRKRAPFSDRRLDKFDKLEEEWHSDLDADDLPSTVETMIHSLAKDTQRALDLVFQPDANSHSLDTEVGFRNILRFLFSEIEGAVFIAATQLYRYGYSDVQPAKELLIGSDEEVRENIVETLESFSRHFGTGVEVERSGDGWNSFPRSRASRNRIVHPVSGRDLNLDQDDKVHLVRTLDWWRNEVHLCLHLR